MINGGIINTVAAAAEVCTTNNSSFPTSNLAYYKLDGDAIDSAGTNNGTASNVTWGVGKFGPAAAFNGTSSKIETGVNLTLQSACSLSVWVYFTGSNFFPIFGGNNIITGTGTTINRHFSALNTTANRFDYVNKAGAFWRSPTIALFNSNAWNHIVITDDFTNSSTSSKLYVNGTQDTNFVILSATYGGAVNTNLYIGQSITNGSNQQYATGTLDQVRIFPTVITQAQVTELYEDEIECCTTDEVNYPVTNLAYYQLNGGTGTTVVDETNTYDGTSSNVTYGAGLFDDAAVFNGSSSYITTSLKSKNVGTLSFWFKGSTPAGLVTLFNNNNVSSNYKGVMIQGQTNGTLRVYIAQGNGIGALDIYTTNTFFDNNWHNAVLTWDLNSSGTNTYLYVDNVVAASGAANTGVWTSGQDSSFGLFIGAGRTNLQFFNGSLDQVRIFPTVITAGQVAELYQEKQCGISIVPNENFNTVLYTGNGTAAGVTKVVNTVGFKPDLVWVKSRSTAAHNGLFDVARGVGWVIYSNLANGEAKATGYHLKSFDTDGFTMEGNSNVTNLNNITYVAWCWKAGDALINNTDGANIISQVSVNTDAGFSVVKWTGDGNTSSTIGHGLTPNGQPMLVIIKDIDASSDWMVLTNNLWASPTTKFLKLNLTNALGTSSGTPYLVNNTVFKNVNRNVNGNEHIAYCFHSVEGFSKFGSYVGTGVSGNSIVTGFNPAFLMAKRTSSTSDWYVIDNKRNPNNPRNRWLNASTNGAEYTPTYGVEFLSNGFSFISTDLNGTGQSWTYMAFAAYN